MTGAPDHSFPAAPASSTLAWTVRAAPMSLTYTWKKDEKANRMPSAVIDASAACTGAPGPLVSRLTWTISPVTRSARNTSAWRLLSSGTRPSS
jgi:hypothetical protein